MAWLPVLSISIGALRRGNPRPAPGPLLPLPQRSKFVCRRSFKFPAACEIPKSCLRRRLRRLTPALPGLRVLFGSLALPPPPRLRRTCRGFRAAYAVLTPARIVFVCIASSDPLATTVCGHRNASGAFKRHRERLFADLHPLQPCADSDPACSVLIRTYPYEDSRRHTRHFIFHLSSFKKPVGYRRRRCRELRRRPRAEFVRRAA